jgi:hypothetical protein
VVLEVGEQAFETHSWDPSASSCPKRPPRTQEAAAAIRDMARAVTSTITSPCLNGPGDQLREEAVAAQGGGLLGPQAVEDRRPEQRPHRVLAQEGGEQAAHRWQVGEPVGGGGRDTVGGQPRVQGGGQAGGQAGDQQR